MNKINKNQKGFGAIELLLIILAVTIIGAVSVYVIHKNNKHPDSLSLNKPTTKTTTPTLQQSSVAKVVDTAPASQTGQVTGTFVQPNNSSWPAAQHIAYIGVNVSNPSKTRKVEWYLNNFGAGSLQHTATSPDVGNLYQYNWPISGLPSGTYHWLAKVYDLNGNTQVVNNSSGNPFVDMIINSSSSAPGTVSGTFVQHEGTSWPNPQQIAYVGVNVSTPSSTSKVEWYLGNFTPSALVFTETSPDVGNLYQYNWPIGGLTSGTYRIFAKVYDSQGNSQIVTNNVGNGYVDMLVKSQ